MAASWCRLLSDRYWFRSNSIFNVSSCWSVKAVRARRCWRTEGRRRRDLGPEMVDLKILFTHKLLLLVLVLFSSEHQPSLCLLNDGRVSWSCFCTRNIYIISTPKNIYIINVTMFASWNSSICTLITFSMSNAIKFLTLYPLYKITYTCSAHAR